MREFSKNIQFEPIKSKRTFEEISSRIKQMIFDGILSPGDKLPTEIELSHQFNVSRQTIREALRLLELSGFITVQKGGTGGPIIENTIFNSIKNSYIDAIQMRSISISDLTLARLEIENIILISAIDNANEENIDKLMQNIIKSKEAINNNIMPRPLCLAFHKILAETSKNQTFTLFSESITSVISGFLSGFEPNQNYMRRIVDDHIQLFEAIKARNKEEALVLMESHLKVVESYILSRISFPSA